MFDPTASFALANDSASSSFGKVSVACDMCDRSDGLKGLKRNTT
jgi:hypothetical protein